MEVFKTYFLVLRKCKVAIIMYAAIALLIPVLMGMGNSDNAEFSAVSLNIGIIDKDESSLGEALIDYFGDEHKIREIEDDRQEILNSLYWDELDYVLLIPEGYGESLKNGSPGDLSCMSVPGHFESAYFESELKRYMGKLQTLIKCGYGVEGAKEELKALSENGAEVELAEFVNKNHNDIATAFLQYMPYLFITLSMMGIGYVLMSFNKKDVRERMECASVPLLKRTMGLAAGAIVYGMLVFILAVAAVSIISKGSILTDSRLLWFLLNMSGMLFFGLSLGFFTGMLAKSAETISGMLNIVSLVLCFMGGVFVPMEFFGEGVKTAAQFFPTYWYVISNEQIGAMTEVNPEFTGDILVRLGMSTAYALVIFAVTLVVVSARRRKK